MTKIVDKAVWVVDPPDNRDVTITVHHGDKYDEQLTLTGNFARIDDKINRAQEICDALNGGRIDAVDLFRTKVSLIKLIDSYISSSSVNHRDVNEMVNNNKLVNILTALKLEIVDSLSS